MSNEINVGAISEALNNKVDLNQLNTNEQGLEYVSGLSMPSSRYIDLTLGASGSTYTAPSNGWFAIHCQQTTARNDSAVVLQVNKLYGNSCSRYSKGASNLTMVPCLKNDTIYLYYDGTININSPYWFRFVYAEGDE